MGTTIQPLVIASRGVAAFKPVTYTLHSNEGCKALVKSHIVFHPDFAMSELVHQ